VIRLAPESIEALQRECEQSLALGRAFVPGAAADAVGAPCVLELVHPEGGGALALRAEVVWLAGEPEPGVGLVLHEPIAALPARLRAFVERSEHEKDAAAPRGGRAESVQERVRGYTSNDALRRAKEADLTERIALERAFGKQVWELLLHNPRISPAEVARIARKGNVTQVVIDTIVANASWLASAEVRRALLANPRVAPAALDKVLRALSRPELALLPKQTAYPPTVRRLAQRLLGGGSD
jgi:hypothetical protein